MAGENPTRGRVVIGGGSGLIGRSLTAALVARGHAVHTLVRRPAADNSEIAWQPETGQIDAARLEGADAVVHLGGENIAGGRWTPARKAVLQSSRVVSTTLLARTIAGLVAKPRVFLCASAIGYYGNRGDAELDESAAIGTGFLPEICAKWEHATRAAADGGVRTVNMRLGVVLARGGGALAAMLRPFKLGLGGVVGDGRQYMSWIALGDVVGAMTHLLAADGVRGAVNLTAPTPVTNREFTKTLGRVLRRPTLLPVPAFAIRALLGEMGETLLLGGARVLPRRLRESGYSFASPTLEQALRAELGLSSG